MAQVQPPREFKFVGGPSRKRRRNGTSATAAASSSSSSTTTATASSKQSKQPHSPGAASSPPSTSSATLEGTSTAHQPLPSSPLSLFHVDLLSTPPRSVFARMPIGGIDEDDIGDTTQGAVSAIHPDIANTIAATLAGLDEASNGHVRLLHHSSSPGGMSSSSCESVPINTTSTESVGNSSQNQSTSGLEGILDWPSEEFMNPFFPAINLDTSMFGSEGNSSTNTATGMMATDAVQSTPAMLLSLPPPSPPQLSSHPGLVHSSHLPPSNTVAEASAVDDVEELPSHRLDVLSANQLPSPPSLFSFDITGISNADNTGKQVQQFPPQQQQQHTSIPADALLMATSPRMYAQPSVLYDTISRIFFQYDQEFCILPLTCDFAANPFRYNMQKMHQSSLLRHCILALSYKHVDYDTGACTSEAAAYKRRATQMLQDEMQSETTGEGQPDASLLDASIVMMTLDRLAQLGLLVWFDVTLALTSRNGCIFPERTILSIFDTPEAPPENNKSAADTSPSEEIPAALDFYAISGCPRELFECMVRLATYAREMQISSTLSCVRFDMAPVMRIERRIAKWQSPAFDDPVKAQDLLDMVMRGRRPLHAKKVPRSAGTSSVSARHRTDSSAAAAAETAAAEKLWRTRNITVEGQDDGGSVLDYRLDLYHCAEAWRYALLIYIERVFKWQNRKWQAERRRRRKEGVRPGSFDDDDTTSEEEEEEEKDSASLLQFLARRTLNHVTSCRRTTFVQKQLMLPVFLAGAEIRDAGLRNDARNYCVWWGSKTRYNMFVTARALLEEVWRRGESEDLWWGDVFDQKGKRGEKEYLLG
ncbi:hypothetical protein SBRCBS47491_000306 [Sporothrix bragantina]|uniref:Uncharacterized protein n=1 Tax=Sporothrix bragantina TaxID=671064 RepID=A0ABP0AP70_9PEZI